MASVTKYIDCFKKVGAAIPREAKQTLLNQIKELEAAGMEPNKAAKQVATEMRDRTRADQQSVMEGIKASKAKPAAVEAKAAPVPAAEAAPTVEIGPPRPPVSEQHQIAQQIVAAHQQAMPYGPKVQTLDREQAAQHLEGKQDARASSARNGTLEGFYDPKTDSAVIIPENVQIREGETVNGAIGRVLTHEVGGHGGWTRLFRGGPLEPEFRGVMDAFWQHQSGQDFGADFKRTHGYGNLDELAARYGYDTSTPEGRANILQEHFARLAEDPAPPKWFDAVITRFTDFFRKLGFNAWTDSDTRILLQKGRDAMGTDRLSAARQAESIRYSLNVGEIGKDPQKAPKFTENIAQGEVFSKKMIEAMRYRQYDPITEKGIQGQANDWINNVDFEQAIQSVRTGEFPGLTTEKEEDRPIVQEEIGRQLIKRLDEQGRSLDSAEVADQMGKIATSHAQALRMFKPFADMSLGGLRAYTEKLTREGFGKNPIADELYLQVQRLKKEMAALKAKYAGRAVVRGTTKGGKGERVQERINNQLVKNEKSIWGRYKDTAVAALKNKLSPNRPRNMPALEVFTKHLTKMLREKIGIGPLAERKGKAPVDEAVLLAEAVNNFDKYKEVWKEAQASVQKDFQDNPEALQSLDDYFDEILDKPFSEQSVTRTVKQVAADLNIRMRNVLMQDDVSKEQIKKQLTDEVVRRTRLSEEDARGIADAVHTEFDRQMKASQEAMIKQLLKAPTPRLSKTELEKLLQENNAGQLDDARLFGKLAKSHGVESWTPELSEKIKALQKKFQRFEAEEKTHGANGNAALDVGNIAEAKRHYGLAETAQDRKDYFGSQMFDAIHDTIPKGFAMYARGFQNLSMLLNGKTLIRNLIGNTASFVFNIPADAVKMFVFDPAWSIVSGKRTRRSLDLAVRAKGLAAPFLDYMQGYELTRAEGASVYTSAVAGLDVARKLGQISSASFLDKDVSRLTSNVYSSQIGKLFENGLSLSLSAADRAFWKAAYDGSIMKQRHLRRIDNRWATPKDPRFWEQPKSEEIEQALAEAGYAVYQNPNKISEALIKARAWINKLTGSKIFGVGSGEIPFGQVPGAMALRAAEWSPAGFIYGSYKFFSVPKEMRQDEVTNVFSRAIVGTAVPGLLGVWLAHLGIASALSDDDPDVREMQKDSGLGKYSINVTAWRRAVLSGNWWTPQEYQDGDLVLDYGWLQPLAFSFAMGVQAYKELTKPAKDKPDVGKFLGPVGPVTMAGVESFADLPMIQGIARTLMDIPEVAKGRKSVWQVGGEHFTSMGAQFVPTFLKQLNNYFDNQVRETRSQADAMGMLGINQVLATVPGLSKNYPPKYDTFGKAIKRYEYGGNGFFNVFINPFTIREMKDNKGVRELNRLHSITDANNVSPNAVERYIDYTYQGIPVKAQLTNEQISEYQRISGELTRNAIGTRLASPEFAAATAGAQAKQIVKDLADVNEEAKRRVVQEFPTLGEQMQKQWNQEAARQQALWWNTRGMRP